MLNVSFKLETYFQVVKTGIYLIFDYNCILISIRFKLQYIFRYWPHSVTIPPIFAFRPSRSKIPLPAVHPASTQRH